MRACLNILFVISIVVNVYLILQIRKSQAGENLEKTLSKNTIINKIKWDEGFKLFKDKIDTKSYNGKKYFYLNIWENWCIPCILEMPLLDSIMGTINNRKIGFVFVSDVSDKVQEYCVKLKHYNIKKFTFINNMNDFISALCNEAKTDSKVFPMHVILDEKGKLFYFSYGSFENVKDAEKLIATLKGLD